VRIIAVSRAPLDKLLACKARMGWRFEWVSSQGEDFNHDFRVSFTEDDIAKGRIDYYFGTIVSDPAISPRAARRERLLQERGRRDEYDKAASSHD
jgi:predicted dithiol-disulfide oxidoreductase (DUF899 family)